MRRSFTFVVLLGVLAGCGVADADWPSDVYDQPIPACALLDPQNEPEIAKGLPATGASEPEHDQFERLEWTSCERTYGDSPPEERREFDERAPETPGRPALRRVEVSVYRYLGKDWESGEQRAAAWLVSFGYDADLAAKIGADAAVEFFRDDAAEVYVVDKNVALVVRYGGANVDAKWPGMPEQEAMAAGARLTKDAVRLLRCRLSAC
jgi:hypothetical protein